MKRETFDDRQQRARIELMLMTVLLGLSYKEYFTHHATVHYGGAHSRKDEWRMADPSKLF